MLVCCVWICTIHQKKTWYNPTNPSAGHQNQTRYEQCPNHKQVWGSLYSTNQLTQINQGKKLPLGHLCGMVRWLPKPKKKWFRLPRTGVPEYGLMDFFGWIIAFVFLVETKSSKFRFLFGFSFLVGSLWLKHAYVFSFHVIFLRCFQLGAVQPGGDDAVGLTGWNNGWWWVISSVFQFSWI